MKYRLTSLLISLAFIVGPVAYAQTSSLVSIQDDYYSPQTLTVSAGTTVSWKNNGMHAHTVTSNNSLFDSGTISPGGTYSRQFMTPGTYYYYCKLHPNMIGTIVVTGSQPNPNPNHYPTHCGNYYSYLCYPQGNYNYNQNYNQNYNYNYNNNSNYNYNSNYGYYPYDPYYYSYTPNYYNSYPSHSYSYYPYQYYDNYYDPYSYYYPSYSYNSYYPYQYGYYGW